MDISKNPIINAMIEIIDTISVDDWFKSISKSSEKGEVNIRSILGFLSSCFEGGNIIPIINENINNIERFIKLY